MGKSTINWPFSIAMLVYQRVFISQIPWIDYGELPIRIAIFFGFGLPIFAPIFGTNVQ
jgi:hypothetical protein